MRNLTEENTTDVVLNAWSKNPGPRFKEIVDAMITHLHEFVREVQLTEDEWGGLRSSIFTHVPISHRRNAANLS